MEKTTPKKQSQPSTTASSIGLIPVLIVGGLLATGVVGGAIFAVLNLGTSAAIGGFAIAFACSGPLSYLTLGMKGTFNRPKNSNSGTPTVPTLKKPAKRRFSGVKRGLKFVFGISNNPIPKETTHAKTPAQNSAAKPKNT